MICYVILHYMVISETSACVESIKKIEGDKKIIIVDNASPNGSVKQIRELYGTDSIVDIVESSSNLGYARGNNLGYEYAVSKYQPDFIVVMNNDMVISQIDFNERIYEAYNEYHFFILGPDIYSTSKKYHQNPQTRHILNKSELQKEYVRLYLKDKLSCLVYLKWALKGKMKNTEKVNHDYSDRKYINQVIVNPLLHGSCYVFSQEFIKKHPQECFFDGTFMYLEAEILYYQAIRDGEKMIYYPNLKVDHHEDKSTDAKLTNQVQKSIFSIRCLKNSVKAFIELMEKDGI